MNDEEPGRKQRGAVERGIEATGLGRGGRMSRQRKTAAVIRLLRGEDLETLSRALGITAATLTAWRDAFLAAGEAALVTRPATGEAVENQRLKAKLGEVLIQRDLLAEKIVALEAGRPLARRRSRP
jgi:transposase